MPQPVFVKSAPASVSAAASRQKPARGKWYILGAVLLVAGLGTAAFFSKRGKTDATAITVEKAFVKTITQVVTATGKVQPEAEVKITPEVTGELVDIPVKEGQTVKKGDLLVKIKPDFYAAQVDQQEAMLASARATSVLSKAHLAKAEQDFKQGEELYGKKLISDADYITAKTALDVAKAEFESSLAQIRRAEGSVSQARDQLSKTIIYAPIEGTVSSLTSEVGERVVSTGGFNVTEIMRIADLDNMEIRVKVNESDIINVKVDDHVVITIDAFPGRRFNGHVTEISNSAQGNVANAQAQQGSDDVTNFLVKIRVAERGVKLRPGMSATADIETQTVENVVAVPIQSVTVRAGGKTAEELQKTKAKEARENSGNELDLATERNQARRDRAKFQRVVFVKQGDKVKMQAVETGIADTSHIEVRSGVQAGDEIVSGSYAAISRKLKDGAKVMIEKPKPEGKK